MIDGLMTLAELSGDMGNLGIGIGLGLTVVGAGIGIGIIGGNACSGIARQPEATNKIQVNMLLAAALIEGVAFASLIFGTFLL